jgi:hypothetical protein
MTAGVRTAQFLDKKLCDSSDLPSDQVLKPYFLSMLLEPHIIEDIFVKYLLHIKKRPHNLPVSAELFNQLFFIKQ